ncbi:MAG: porphobilinogen synthase [Halobacteriota archaeon]
MVHRPSRLRRKGVASLVRETSLRLDDLICPLFVDENLERPAKIASLPGFYRHSVESAVHEAGTVADLGLPAILIFGVPRYKDETGSAALSGVVQDTISDIKAQVPGVTIIADLCLCEYTNHGHCGVVDEEGIIADGPTLEMLRRVAVTYAQAGVDLIAPSGMIDGMVGAVRAGLDERGFEHIPIMSYAAKYCSHFYEPFRDAVDSSFGFADRSQHQMDPANTEEAIREVRLDVREGADIIMIKPALSYLDIIYRIKQTFTIPVAAYSVSGEYLMLHKAIANNYLRPDVIYETLLSIRRAGADMIVTYFAKEAARNMR